MKLRVKYQSTRTVIEVKGEDTLENIREKVKHIPTDQNAAWFLSLNGVDEMETPSGATLDTLGVVGGDLIHILESSEQDSSHSLEQQLIDMGFVKANVEKVVRSFGATNLNDALELLNMLGGSPNKSAAQVPSQVEQPSKKIEVNENKQPELELPTSAASSETSRQNVPAIKPLFLCDGATDSFINLVNQVKCETASDYLYLAVHSLMLETGLRTKASFPKDEEVTNQQQNERHPVACLPEHWRNPGVGFYRISYIYKSYGNDTCCLTGTVTGNSLVVSGTLDRDDSDVVYQIKLNITDFVNKSRISATDVGDVFKNLNKLSHKIKENIANKLLDEIRNKLGLTHQVIGLQSLPDELKLRLVCYLTAQSVCRLSQVAREWRELCNDQEIWKRLLFREFRGTNLLGSSYKEAFKCMHKLRQEEREREKRLLEARTPMRPEFEVPPDIMYPERHPMVPGMIGGRHDLYPIGGYQPGGFPTVPPFAPGPSHPDILRQPPNSRGPPPGARFDPYGPIPDDEDFNHGRRRNHPDTLHRPGFGSGSGFGGGFGFM